MAFFAFEEYQIETMDRVPLTKESESQIPEKIQVNMVYIVVIATFCKLAKIVPMKVKKSESAFALKDGSRE